MTEQTQPSAGSEPTATSETESTSAIPQTPAEAPAKTAERLAKADDEAAAQADATLLNIINNIVHIFKTY